MDMSSRLEWLGRQASRLQVRLHGQAMERAGEALRLARVNGGCTPQELRRLEGAFDRWRGFLEEAMSAVMLQGVEEEEEEMG